MTATTALKFRLKGEDRDDLEVKAAKRPLTSAKSKYDPYKIGNIYKFERLMPEHQKEFKLWYTDKEIQKWGVRFIREQVTLKDMLKHHRGPWVAYDKAKTADKERIDKICEALDNGGTMRPLLLDEDYDLLEGQHRIQAAFKRGDKDVPVVRALGTASKLGI